LAVDHHHPLRALAAFGLADRFAPFLAIANEPSATHSSQARSQRRQVLYEGNRSGMSLQRPPLRRSQSNPSKKV
jgi:hypothetical protein